MSEYNLKEYRPLNSTSFIGRVQGEEVRKKLSLEDLDNDDSEIVLKIPADTTSFNPSFFLGLLYKSIKKLGVEGFRKKYELRIESTDPSTKNAISRNLEDGFRNAINSINNKDGVTTFG
jgi:hypothetical protein